MVNTTCRPDYFILLHFPNTCTGNKEEIMFLISNEQKSPVLSFKSFCAHVKCSKYTQHNGGIFLSY